MEDRAMTMVSTTLACSSCWNPIGAGAQPIWLYDLAFHEVCAPHCRACQRRLTPTDEHRFSYDGNVVSNRAATACTRPSSGATTAANSMIAISRSRKTNPGLASGVRHVAGRRLPCHPEQA